MQGHRGGLILEGTYIPFGPIFKKMYEITVPQLSLEILQKNFEDRTKFKRQIHLEEVILLKKLF